MKKVFVDTDILLDLLTGREPFHAPAAALFTLSEKGIIAVFTSSLIFSDLFHILKKSSTGANTWKVLARLRHLVNILAVDEAAIDRALYSRFGTFENAVQNYTAEAGGMTHFITRNVKDFKASTLKVMTADDFLQLQGL